MLVGLLTICTRSGVIVSTADSLRFQLVGLAVTLITTQNSLFGITAMQAYFRLYVRVQISASILIQRETDCLFSVSEVEVEVLVIESCG